MKNLIFHPIKTVRNLIDRFTVEHARLFALLAGLAGALDANAVQVATLYSEIAAVRRDLETVRMVQAAQIDGLKAEISKLATTWHSELTNIRLGIAHSNHVNGLLHSAVIGDRPENPRIPPVRG